MPGQKHKTVSPLSDQNSPKKQKDTSDLFEINDTQENEHLTMNDITNNDVAEPEQAQAASVGVDAIFSVSEALRENRDTLDKTATHTASHELPVNQTNVPNA